MQLLIMSDTHGDEHVIERVKGFYPHANFIIHCGDSELTSDHRALNELVYVKGNCDRDEQFPTERTISVGPYTVFVTHGHLFNVKSSLMSLSYRAREVSANIVCFGHSHLLGAERINDTLFLNPGSLKSPRGRKEKTFMVVDIVGELATVQCLTDENVCLEKMEFNLSIKNME